MKKIKRPCTRNIRQFEKSGCPEKAWDGSSGCPNWMEDSLPDPSNPIKKTIVKCCADVLNVIYTRHVLSLLEANVRTTEKLRNGLIDEDADGKTAPKTHPQVMGLFLGCQDQINEMKKTNDVLCGVIQKAANQIEGNSNGRREKTITIG